jgi:hypothetical protein
LLLGCRLLSVKVVLIRRRYGRPPGPAVNP